MWRRHSARFSAGALDIALPTLCPAFRRPDARNVQGAFRVPAECKAKVPGRRPIPIDDVLASGATSDACARALLRAGARSVDLPAFARVVDAVPATI